MSKTYKNYEELLENEEKLALELLEEKGEGNWQQEDIYYHEDIEIFAEYEMYDGWYSELNLEGRDYNGAPRIGDFVDLKGLGEALVRNWDDSSNFKSKNGSILQTSWGW